MNAWFPRAAALLTLALLGVLGAAAAPRAVEAFDARSWAQLRGAASVPTAVVFTTTDCAYCPAAIEAVAGAIREKALRAQLVTVVMDVGPGAMDEELLAHPPYRASNRLFAFAEAPAPLRHAVNPSWRGITPYVVLLRPGAAPAWITGRPSAEALTAWAGR